MTNTHIIAIDGPAASGKGTLARRLAEELGFVHMDTGALYRAVGFEVLAAGGDPENEADALAGVEALQAKLDTALENPELRDEHVGEAASKVAAIESVRAALLDLQRNFAKNPGADYNGAVLDGRDIGTVVCPDAPVKLFITASTEVRAERRLKELQLKSLQSAGEAVTYEAVLKDMRARDARDSGRETAPLRPADDAETIDTSDLSADEAFEKSLSVVKGKLLI